MRRPGRLRLGAALAAGAVLAACGGQPAPDVGAGVHAAANRVDATGAAPAADAALLPLRAVVEAITLRHGVRLVVDAGAAARLAGSTAVPVHGDEAVPEPDLRRLLAGFELVFQYGADAHGGRDRLKALWVFERDPAALLAAAPMAAPTAAAPVGPGLLDADENARLQAVQGFAGPAGELRQLVEQDTSEAVRVEALQAFAAHPESGADEVRSVLARLGQGGSSLLAEQARAMLEGLAAPAEALPPEPVEMPDAAR